MGIEIMNANSLTVLEAGNMGKCLINCSCNFIIIEHLILLYTDSTTDILAHWQQQHLKVSLL